MKRQLLLATGVAVALNTIAQSGITFAWGNLIDGPTTAGDQSTGIAANNNGEVYWLGIYGSNDSNSGNICYGGDAIFHGAPYSGNSNNGNFLLIKTTSDGDKEWAIYSNTGDFANNEGSVATTSDGGCVVASKVRHTDGYTDSNLSLSGADGNTVTIDWTSEKRYYRLMVNKISSDGEIEWTRMIDLSTQPGPGASGNNQEFWADCFKLGTIAVDDSDNIYIPLNYRNTLSVPAADGEEKNFACNNNTSWSGDSQTAAGDFMILGLDPDGYYRNSLQLDGSAVSAQCCKLVWQDGQLYAQGLITGDGSELSVQGHGLMPSEITSLIVLRTDAGLNVKWAKCFAGEKVDGKFALQNVGISAVGDNLWICGMFNEKLTDPDNADNYVTASQGSVREGFILKISADNGGWIIARDSRQDDFDIPSAVAKTGLTGYMDVLQANDSSDKLYVYGYVMNAAVGVFLREYNATTLEANLVTGQNNILTGGGVPSTQCIAYDRTAGYAYITARGNKAFQPIGADPSVAPAGWGIYAARFNLPEDMMTGLSDIIIEADQNVAAEYFNLQGIRVTNPQKGLYIRRQGQSVSKIIL